MDSMSIAIAGQERIYPKADFCEECQALVDAEEQAARERQAKAARKWREENIEELLARVGVPRRYLGASLQNFNGKKPKLQVGFITGPPGVGKTHLAVALLREDIVFKGRDAGRFVRTVDLLKEIRDSFQEHSAASERAILDNYGRKVPFLVIDDLGTEKISDWVEQTLYDLIDRRYVEMLPTIITSNLSLDEIEAHYGNHGKRLASRIYDLGEVFVITGKDRRVKRAG